MLVNKSIKKNIHSDIHTQTYTYTQTHTHTHTHTTVGRTPPQEGSPVARTSTWKHTTFTRDIHPCSGVIRTHKRDSNSQSQ